MYPPGLFVAILTNNDMWHIPRALESQCTIFLKLLSFSRLRAHLDNDVLGAINLSVMARFPFAIERESLVADRQF